MLDLNKNKIINIGAPTDKSDLFNLEYLDTFASSILSALNLKLGKNLQKIYLYRISKNILKENDGYLFCSIVLDLSETRIFGCILGYCSRIFFEKNKVLIFIKPIDLMIVTNIIPNTIIK